MQVARSRVGGILRQEGGTSAVEFALIAPIAIMLFVGFIMFSFVLSSYSALQQIAAEAARAAIPGLNATEQAQFANQYISSVMPAYGFLDATKLVVTTTTTASTFNVTLTYDAGSSFFSNFGSSLVSTPIVITRGATVQLSGF